jgi:RNA polymerase sigma-70 factor, ECF subfamily
VNASGDGKTKREAAARARRLAKELGDGDAKARILKFADELEGRVDATQRPEQTPATLGDVLYARSKDRVSEQEWAALVQAIAAGDQLALHGLYERAHRPVFTLALRITANRETAEEIVVDLFHDVWRRASSYDPANGTVLGWIMNQARSRAIDRLRFENRKKRRNDGDQQSPAEVAADPRDMVELAEQGEALRTALAALTPDERQAIEATFFAGLTHAEAAARLDQPLGTVKTRIRSALNKLRRVLSTNPSLRV